MSEINNNPLVSVIVPSYNYGHFITDALNSVLHQNYSNWECIVIDDGSTDSTQSVVSEYIRQHGPRFRYHAQTNQGLSAARNAGLRLAKGEFIQLLDADDLLSATKIANQVLRFKQNAKADIVYGPISLFDGTPSNLHASTLFELQPPKSGDGRVILESLIEDNLFLVNSALFKSSVHYRVGFFDEHMKTCEDWNYWFRCAMNGCFFEYDGNEKSMGYCRNHGQNMSSNRKSMWFGRRRFRREVKTILLKQKRNDEFDGKLFKRNEELLFDLERRYELAYGSVVHGLAFTGQGLLRLRFEVLRDSVYWVKERLLGKL